MTQQRHPRTHGHTALIAALILVVAIITVYWAWNSAGVSLFAMPPASFGEITALLIGIITVLCLLRVFLSGTRKTHHRK